MITVPEEAEKFKNQAAQDWETLLLARAKELVSGKKSLFRQLAPIICLQLVSGLNRDVRSPGA